MVPVRIGKLQRRMDCRVKFTLIFSVVCCFSISNCEKLTKLRFSSPKLTEEETESNFLPSVLKCDACTAVVHQVTTAFIKREKLTKDKVLLQSDVLDALENVCDGGFDNYGLKEVSGEHRLSGPGLDTEGQPGMVQAGGKWPRRIRDLCLVGIGEIDEMEIYSAFKANSGLKELFCRNYCVPDEERSEL